MDKNKFEVGQRVRIKSKSIGLPYAIVEHTKCNGSLIDQIGTVYQIVPTAIYVEVGNDLLAFCPEDLTIATSTDEEYQRKVQRLREIIKSRR